MLLKHVVANADELIKLAQEGFGRYVDRSEMETDKFLETKKCFSAFIKNDIRDMDDTFFRGLPDNECSAAMYEKNYTDPMDITMKKVALQYHTNLRYLAISPEMDPSDSKYNFIMP